MVASARALRLLKRAQRKYTIYQRTRHAQQQLQHVAPPYKLHLGCGTIHLDGWINVDLNRDLDTVDVIWDLTHPLPFADNSTALVYHEHLIEHLSVQHGLDFLRQCYRVLMPGGTLRIATPDLGHVVRKYGAEDWRDQAWLTKVAYQFIQTPAEMLNVSMRWWGHQWLYDREELCRRLQEAGFTTIRDVDWGQSEIPDLQHLETRPDSFLICEAQK